MIRLCTRLCREDCVRLNNSFSLFDCWPKLTTHFPSSSPLLCRNLQSTTYLFSEENVVPKQDLSLNETINPLTVSIIDNVQGYGFTKHDITKLVKGQPRLLKTSVNAWPEIMRTLLSYGFEKEEVLRILTEWPEILRFNKTALEENFTAWTNCGFGEELLFKILTTYPIFLKVDHMHVLRRVKQYQALFESKQKVGKLLLLAPNVLEESWTSICDKLNYLDELCTSKSDIVSTGVLAHSLFHISARHEFLIKAGVYKKPQKDFNKKLSKNPSLHRIVNTSDKEFISKIAQLSLFEYTVFMDLLKKELDDSEPIDDSDSDGETHKDSYNTRFKNK